MIKAIGLILSLDIKLAGGQVLSDPFLVATVLLLLTTMGVVVLYYRRIRKTQEEYNNAKGVVGDVITSFNKQLQRQEESLDIVAHKIEPLASKSEEIVKKMEASDRRLAKLAAKIEDVSGIEQKALMWFEEANKKIQDVKIMQERTMQKIAELEKLGQKVPVRPEAKIEAVIPIKTEKALAPLTETELIVLETLATEGGMTAPEIMRKILLSREHAARLMKKLYEKGYLERDTRKTPYSYYIKKEMLKILKKGEKTKT